MKNVFLVANILNAAKSSMARTDGKGAHRNSKLKRKIRTSMNKRKRSILKIELFNELTDNLLK